MRPLTTTDYSQLFDLVLGEGEDKMRSALEDSKRLNLKSKRDLVKCENSATIRAIFREAFVGISL